MQLSSWESKMVQICDEDIDKNVHVETQPFENMYPTKKPS